MTSSSPGKWSKNKFLPRITDSNASASTGDENEDFDIDSFDKLLDELTHDSTKARKKNACQDENKTSQPKKSSEFHLPPIDSVPSGRQKPAMYRKRKGSDKHSTCSKDELFQQKSHGIGKRSLNILNEELRTMVSAAIVPLPPMKTSLLSSIVDPMEVIPEEPSNTSINDEVSNHPAGDSKICNSTTLDKKTIEDVTKSEAKQPSQVFPKRFTPSSKEVIINSFYDDALSTELPPSRSSSTSQNSRWSSTFDCSLDPSETRVDRLTQRSLNYRPRAPKRAAIGQYGSGRSCFSNTEDYSSTRKSSSSQGYQRSTNTAPDNSRRPVGKDVGWRNSRPTSSYASYHSRLRANADSVVGNPRVRSWIRPKITTGCRKSDRSSIDDWLWRTAISIPRSSSSICSSLSTGTLAPIQEVSSSSENSGSQNSESGCPQNEPNSIHSAKHVSAKSENEYSHTSSEDTTLSESEKIQLQKSSSDPSSGDNTSHEESHKAPVLNIDIHPHSECFLAKETEKVPDTASEVKCTENKDLKDVCSAVPPIAASQSSPVSSSSSSNRTSRRTPENPIPTLSTISSETIDTHLSQVSSSVIPTSGSSESKPSQKEQIIIHESSSLQSIQNISCKKPKCSSPIPCVRTISESSNLEINPQVEGKISGDPTFNYLQYTEDDTFQESTKYNITCGSPPISCFTWGFHSFPRCETPSDSDVNATELNESPFTQITENEISSPYQDLWDFSSLYESENEKTPRQTSPSNGSTYLLSDTADPLNYIPVRSPQTYITTWRCSQQEPSMTSTYSIRSNVSNQLSHVSDGSTYTLSSPWKMISSEDEESNVSNADLSQNFSGNVCGRTEPHHIIRAPFEKLFPIDSIYTPITTSPHSRECSEGEQVINICPHSRDSHISTSTFVVMAEDSNPDIPRPEVNSSAVTDHSSFSQASHQESDDRSSCSLPLSCEMKLRHVYPKIIDLTKEKNSSAMSTPFKTLEVDNMNCQYSQSIARLPRTADEPYNSTFQLVNESSSKEPLRSLVGRYENKLSIRNQTEYAQISSRISTHTCLVNTDRNFKGVASTSSMAFAMRRSLAPPCVAACYVNYSPASLLSNRKSVAARPIIRRGATTRNECCIVPCAQALASKKLHPQPVPYPSKPRTIINNEIGKSRQVDGQHFIFSNYTPIPRQHNVVNTDTLSHTNIKDSVLPKLEKSSSEYESSLRERDPQNSAAFSCVAESIKSLDTNQDETRSSATQVTVMENANYFLVAPAVNETYMSSLSQTLAPGTFLISTSSSKGRVPLFTVPSEKDFFRSSLTKIVMASEPSIVGPDINIPITGESIMLRPDIQTTQKNITSENSKLEDTSINKVDEMPSICNKNDTSFDTRNSENPPFKGEKKLQEIVETDIEIFDLTSLSNDESAKVCVQLNICSQDVLRENDPTKNQKRILHESRSKSIIKCKAMADAESKPHASSRSMSNSSVETIDYQDALSSQDLNSRSPSPVSTYSFYSEKTNDQSLVSVEIESIDTSSVASEVSELNEVDVSLCSSRSYQISSDVESIVELECLENRDINCDDCMEAIEQIRKDESPVKYVLSDENIKYTNVTPVAGDLQSSDRHSSKHKTKIEKSLSDQSIALSIESITTDASKETDEGSKYCEICRSNSATQAYQSSEFETLESSSISNEKDIGDNNEDNDSVPSIILGTPPKNKFRVGYPLAMASFQNSCDKYYLPLNDMNENRSAVVSPTAMYSESDFENSISSESTEDLSVLEGQCYVNSTKYSDDMFLKYGDVNSKSIPALEYGNIPMANTELQDRLNSCVRPPLSVSSKILANQSSGSERIKTQRSSKDRDRCPTTQLPSETKISSSNDLHELILNTITVDEKCNNMYQYDKTINVKNCGSNYVRESPDIAQVTTNNLNSVPSENIVQKSLVSQCLSAVSKRTKPDDCLKSDMYAKDNIMPKRRRKQIRASVYDTENKIKYIQDINSSSCVDIVSTLDNQPSNSLEVTSNSSIYSRILEGKVTQSEMSSTNISSTNSISQFSSYNSHRKSVVNSDILKNHEKSCQLKSMDRISDGSLFVLPSRSNSQVKPMNDGYCIRNNYSTAEKPESSLSSVSFASHYSSYHSHKTFKIKLIGSDKPKKENKTEDKKGSKVSHCSISKSRNSKVLLLNKEPSIKNDIYKNVEILDETNIKLPLSPDEFSTISSYGPAFQNRSCSSEVCNVDRNATHYNTKDLQFVAEHPKNCRSKKYIALGIGEPIRLLAEKSAVSQSSDQSSKQLTSSTSSYEKSKLKSLGSKISKEYKNSKEFNVTESDVITQLKNVDGADKKNVTPSVGKEEILTLYQTEKGPDCVVYEQVLGTSANNLSNVSFKNEEYSSISTGDYAPLPFESFNYIRRDQHSSKSEKTRSVNHSYKQSRNSRSCPSPLYEVSNNAKVSEVNFSPTKDIQFSSFQPLSAKLLGSTFNASSDTGTNDHAVDCLLPVRTLRTYSLEALSAESQLELSLIQLQMQVRSSRKSGIMKNFGRCAASLVSLPRPSSKSAHASDSRVGTSRSSCDTQSSDSSNDGPTCKRRHTRPCVHIETKESPKNFRTPLASPHPSVKPSNSDEACNATVEIMYCKDDQSHSCVSKSAAEIFGNSLEINDGEFVGQVPSRTQKLQISESCLDLDSEVSVNVLVGYDGKLSRPSSPPAHASREPRENAEVRSLSSILTNLPSSVVAETKNIEKLSSSSLKGSQIQCNDSFTSVSGDKYSEISSQGRKFDGQRFVRFSPNITYIWRTGENNISDTYINTKDVDVKNKIEYSEVSSVHTRRESPAMENSGNGESAYSSTVPYQLEDVNDNSFSLTSENNMCSSVPTVTLYRSMADSDSSSFGLVSIHRSSISSGTSAWCTIDDSAEETVSNFSMDRYYPLPGTEGYPKYEIPNLLVENGVDQYQDYVSTVQSARSSNDGCCRSINSSRALSSPMGLIQESDSDTTLSVSDSLLAVMSNIDPPMTCTARVSVISQTSPGTESRSGVVFTKSRQNEVSKTEVMPKILYSRGDSASKSKVVSSCFFDQRQLTSTVNVISSQSSSLKNMESTSNYVSPCSVTLQNIASSTKVISSRSYSRENVTSTVNILSPRTWGDIDSNSTIVSPRPETRGFVASTLKIVSPQPDTRGRVALTPKIVSPRPETRGCVASTSKIVSPRPGTRENIASTSKSISPRPGTRLYSKKRRSSDQRTQSKPTISNKTERTHKSASVPLAPYAGKEEKDVKKFPLNCPIVSPEHFEDYFRSPSTVYDEFRLQKLYSGSSLTEPTTSFHATYDTPVTTLPPPLERRLSLEEIPSMRDLRRPIRPSTPPYGVRYNAPSQFGGRRGYLEAGDGDPAARPYKRRHLWRRDRRAESRRRHRLDRERRLLRVQARRPSSGEHRGDSRQGRGRRRRFARLRQCFRGVGDAIVNVFTQCCD